MELNTFQIAYYAKPEEDRLDRQDHTVEFDFESDFDAALAHIVELKNQGYFSISLDELVDGVVFDSIRIADYIDEWEAA
jgi:hypothetical protein